MKTIVKFSLTLLAAGILSACGSSSDGDNNSAPTTANTATTNATTTNTGTTNSGTSSNQNNPTTSTETANSGNTSANNPTNTNPVTPAKTHSPDAMGSAFRTSDSKAFDIKKAATYNAQLVVDGKTFPVSWNGIRSGGFTKLSNSTINGITYKDFTVSGTRYENTKFGHIDGYVFVQGDITSASDVPTTGAATYKVDGVFVENGTTSTSNNHILNVDFANKTVNGEVAPNVTITNANITGNAFDGNAVYNGKSAELSGHFYGPSAAELGGAYSSSSFSGAFGGKKQ